MFTSFKTTNSVVFLDPHTENFPESIEGSKIELILSPSLYWVKKLSLPVKYISDVKKLLPSIFEDILPEGNYSYAVFKEDEGYLAFAYEDKKIIEELAKKDLAISSVSNVYFAQTELIGSAPCKINEQEVLVVEDELLFIAPSSWFGSLEMLSLNDLSLSKKTIKLQQFSHIIDNRSLYKIGALLGMFIALLLVEIFITSQKIDGVSAEKEKVFEKYQLYPTMMQNRTVLQEYTSRFAKQTKLRDLIEAVLNIRLNKDQKIKTIRYKNKVLHVVFEGLDQLASKKVLGSLESYKKSIKSSFKGKFFEIEVEL